MSRVKTKKTNTRADNKVVLIVCEGRETEKNYFNNYNRKDRRDRPVKIIKGVSGQNFTELVNRCKNEMIKIDAKKVDAYIVVDVDGRPENNLQRLKKDADSIGSKVIISNPCFEFWYLIHFEDTAANMATYKNLEPKLLKYIKDYDKSKNYFDILEPLTDEAIKRAERLENKNIDDNKKSITGRNPSTEVYKLVKALRS